jgi:hypothetical protein
MATTYVQVPSEDIIATLTKAGFVPVQLTDSWGKPLKELVYERAHEENPAVKIRVYTSISNGYAFARKHGKDSIKVCTIVDNGRKTFGIGKFPRVHRTGSVKKVLDRMLQRMRAAYERGTEWLREQAIKDVMLA